MQGGSATAAVRREQVGQVAVLVMANPPVNALSSALRTSLAEELGKAIADPTVTAIVISGEGRGFCAGADISEFGKLRTGPRLGDLCLAIEASPKPVIAAIHGMALGGGMELALAAHYRVAGAGAVLGLPEVNLGILPGAGGTQRLPRILGARQALRLMLTGVPIAANEAASLGLVDRLTDKGITDTAVAMAMEGLPARPTAARRDGFAEAGPYLAAVNEARAAQAGNRLPAPGRIVDLVEAALVFPLAQGLVAEQTAFGELVATPEAAGLRHAFFAERRGVQLSSAIAAVPLPAIETIGLWGAGEEIADLALQALASGLKLHLAAQDRDALVSTISAIAARQEADVGAGRLTSEARDADWARLIPSVGPEALAGTDLVLRATEAAALPDDLARRLTHAVIGAANDFEPVALTIAMGKSGLAELGVAPGAKVTTAAALVGLARRLNWRLVPVGPGGPVELGLRLALADALSHLARQGMDIDRSTQALARWLRPKHEGGATTAEDDDRIISTCLSALAAEGARMLEDGRAPRPATIDAIALFAGLVPRWQGGPMFQADQRGILVLRRDLVRLAGIADVFRPTTLLDRLIADGQSFANLNEARG